MTGNSETDNKRTVNYLVENYADLRDVVSTIEKMVMDATDQRNKSILRQGSGLSIIPLKERRGYIVRLKLHPDVLK